MNKFNPKNLVLGIDVATMTNEVNQWKEKKSNNKYYVSIIITISSSFFSHDDCMRRLNDDDNQDSPDEMTELLSSQDDIGPEVHCSILIFNQTNALRVSFFFSLSY